MYAKEPQYERGQLGTLTLGATGLKVWCDAVRYITVDCLLFNCSGSSQHSFEPYYIDEAPETPPPKPSTESHGADYIMHCFTIALATTALLAPSFALPQANPVVPADYWWNVTRSQSGCSGGVCIYDFQIAAPADDNRPHFKAHCSGKGNGRFKACELLEGETNVGPPEVLAKLQPEANPDRPDGIGRIGVRLAFSNLADDG